eukprot:scaffold138968_cov17-Tisochrysis_lutea.AAC.2
MLLGTRQTQRNAGVSHSRGIPFVLIAIQSESRLANYIVHAKILCDYNRCAIRQIGKQMQGKVSTEARFGHGVNQCVSLQLEEAMDYVSNATANFDQDAFNFPS